MAVGKSGYFDLVVSTYSAGSATVRFWWQENYDVAGNFSTITLTQIAVQPSHGFNDGEYYVNADITADGVLVARLSGNQYSVYSSSDGFLPLVINQTSGKIYHDNATGEKTITLTATLTGNLFSNDAGWSAGSGASVSKTVSLYTIPRASELSVSNGTLGTAQTLTVDRKSSGYTHTIAYNCGGTWGTICEKSASTSIRFTLPLSLASKNTTGTSVSVVFWIVTYSGSTQIGEPSSKTVSMSIPSSVGLTVSDGWATVKPYNTGTAAADMDVFVQGYSKAQVSFDSSKISTANAYGAEIASYQITCAGKKYSSPYVTDILTSSGIVNITVKVIDTRGRSVSAALTITVQSYAKPIMSNINIFRCNSYGVETDEGTYLSVTAKTDISSLSGLNAATMQLKIGSLMTVDIPNNETVIVGNALVLSTATYVVSLVSSDRLGNTATHTQIIPTAEVFFHGRQGGKGAAFGKYSEADDLLDVDWNATFRKDVNVQGGIFENGSPVFTFKRMLTAEDNLDDVLENGIYFYNTNSVPANAPFPNAAVIEVFGTNLKTSQKIQRGTRYGTAGKSKWRPLYNSAWLDWKSYATIEDTYPVGAIYISTVATSPASLFGGTWTQLSGRFLLACSGTYTAGSTGGAATVTLTEDQMPRHRHPVNYNSQSGTIAFPNYSAVVTQYQPTGGNYNSAETASTGGNEAHPNMPPYLAVYMWKRTA